MGSEMCIRDRYNPDFMGSDKLFVLMPKTELYLELNDEKYQSIVNASAGF